MLRNPSSRRLTSWALLAGWVLTSIAVWGWVAFELARRHVGPLPAVASAAGTDDGDVADSSDGVAIPDRLGRGDTLASVLHRNGLSNRDVYEVGRALSAVMDVRHLRAGDELRIRYSTSGAEAVEIQRGPRERIFITRTDGGWQSETRSVPVSRRTVALAGVLRGSLFESMARLGEKAPLTVAIANVFAWDFDFHTQSREGDRFSVVVDKLYRDGEFIGYGDLRAARYIPQFSSETVLTAFLYEDPTGKRDYYDADGKSLRKAFLRAPLEFQRISSGFSYSRLHPVHKVRRPHLGVDYAAPTGTPVYSVASGVVTDHGYRGGGGNMVTVRHSMGYTTKYLHLSRFVKGLRKGMRVEQKQVIGYVGRTGTATGPHLDFRLYRHGKALNPVTQIFPPGPPVGKDYRDDFDAHRARLETRLDVSPRTRAVDVGVD